MDAIDRAGHDLVHNFPGGAPALAPCVNMNAGTLTNKANALCTNHQFNVREILAIQLHTGDLSMLKAEAQVLGCVVVELKDHSECSDIELLETYAEYHKEIGETSAAIRDALKNRTISKVDYDLIEKEAYEDVTVMFELLARLKALSS